MPIARVLHDGLVPVKLYTNDVSAEALAQLGNIARLPIVHGHVAAMPDVHLGIGATVGAVIATRRAIVPAAVGVDIGCGMNALRLSLNAARLPDSLTPLRHALEAAIPVGFAQHRAPVADATLRRALAQRLAPVLERHPGLRKRHRDFDRSWAMQLGTLGGGNHFIELCLDEADRVWVMLHSGSRGIGNAIGRHFIALAREDMGRQLARLPDRDLAYFEEGSAHFADYLAAVEWAQHYALVNRRQMLQRVLAVLAARLPAFQVDAEAIECHHNYVAREHHYGADVYVTRKGAIRAGLGELGIIPGSMGTRSYIVRGRGAPESFCSCAHGAGRRMSRNEARRRFDSAALAAQTAGVECRKDAGVVDEIPAAYKDIDTVMAQQHDLVEVVHTLRQVVCIKG